MKKKTKDAEGALVELERYAELRESIFNENQSKQISELQEKYESEKKEAENEILRQQEEKNAIIIQQQLLAIVLASIIVVLLLAMLIFVYRGRRRERLAKELLIEKSKEIEQKNIQLSELNESKDQILSVIGHDLRGPIGGIQGLLGLLAQDKVAIAKNQYDEVINLAQQSVTSAYTLLENLLYWARNQLGELKPDKREVNLSEIAHETVNLLLPQATQKTIEIKKEMEESVIARVDPQMISTIFRNLISNALKFTNQFGYVRVKVANEDGNCTIEVEDNGIGMDEEKMKELFRTSAINTKGTNKEVGTGLGMLVSKNFVEKHGGTISVESATNQGTTFTILLPIEESVPERITLD